MTLAVIHAAAHRYFVTPADLIGRSRYGIFVEPRAVAILILRERYGMSYRHIGRMLDGRDHSAIRSLHHKALAMVASDPVLARFVAGHMDGPRLPPPLEAFKARANVPAPPAHKRWQMERYSRAMREMVREVAAA